MKKEHTTRQVIENKLLTALDDKTKVALLLTKEDCEVLHAALCGYEIATRNGDVLHWGPHMEKRRELATGIKQLMDAAFPKETTR